MKKYLLAFVISAVSLCSHASNKEDVSRTLDALHQAASDADFDTYFSLYAPEAVFIGTDASEVWTIDAFKDYAKPVFDRRQGWTYIPHHRHIYFSAGNDVAWFDELLDNASYGLSRGTGVLEKSSGEWKVTQYHLTFPIPNSIAKDITKQIKQAQKEQ